MSCVASLSRMVLLWIKGQVPTRERVEEEGRIAVVVVVVMEEGEVVVVVAAMKEAHIAVGVEAEAIGVGGTDTEGTDIEGTGIGVAAAWVEIAGKVLGIDGVAAP